MWAWEENIEIRSIRRHNTRDKRDEGERSGNGGNKDTSEEERTNGETRNLNAQPTKKLCSNHIKNI